MLRRLCLITARSIPRSLALGVSDWLGLSESCRALHCSSVFGCLSVEPNRAILQAKDWKRPIDCVILNAPKYDGLFAERAFTRLENRSGHCGLCMQGEFRKSSALASSFLPQSQGVSL